MRSRPHVILPNWHHLPTVVCLVKQGGNKAVLMTMKMMVLMMMTMQPDDDHYDVEKEHIRSLSSCRILFIRVA